MDFANGWGGGLQAVTLTEPAISKARKGFYYPGKESMIDTAAINAQINIRAVAESAGAKFHRNSSACPVHGGDNPTAFSIFDNGRAWKCWTHEAECNQYGYDGIALLRALNGWTFQEVAEKLGKPIDPQEAARRAIENAKRREQELQESIRKAEEAIRELRQARKWLEYHDCMGDVGREAWRARGVADSMQNYWGFGYAPDFHYAYAKEYYTSPTLSIPLFEIRADEPSNVKHRLQSPIEPKSKYRYEKSDIPAQPFYGDRDLPLDAALRTIIVEGEINGAVTFQLIDGISAWQVIGMPSKNQRHRIWPDIAGKLQGQDVWIIPDPDAAAEGLELARMIGRAHIIHLPAKVDDLVNAGEMDRARFCRLMDGAVVVR